METLAFHTPHPLREVDALLQNVPTSILVNFRQLSLLEH